METATVIAMVIAGIAGATCYLVSRYLDKFPRRQIPRGPYVLQFRDGGRIELPDTDDPDELDRLIRQAHEQKKADQRKSQSSAAPIHGSSVQK